VVQQITHDVRCSPWGTLRVSGKQNALFSLGPVIKCVLKNFYADHIDNLVMIRYSFDQFCSKCVP